MKENSTRAFLAALFFAWLVFGVSAMSRAYVPPVLDDTARRIDFQTFQMHLLTPQPRFSAYDWTLLPVPPPAPSAPLPVIEPDPLVEAEKKKLKFDAEGYRYIKFRTYSSSGNQTRFQSTQGLFAQGSRIEQGTDLTVTASMEDKYNLTGSFYEMPSQDRQMDFELAAGLYRLHFGDLTVDFQGGAFSPFSKKITGIEFGYEAKKTYLQFITSQSKSQTRTETFTGRNIKGPYDLSANDLIPDRVTVKLNSEVLGKNRYILDAFLGTITFYEVITPNDVVTITYEQRLRGSLNAGNLMGMAAGYRTDKYKFGMSHLVQEANTSAQSVQTAVSDETAVFNIADGSITVANDFIARTRDLGSETIKKVTGTGTAVLESGVDYNAGMGIAEKMANYRNGRFVLANPDPSATYLVSYAYYPQDGSILQQQIKERLAPIAGLATLSKQTVYYGSEEVSVCFDASLDTIQTVLVRGVDYEIDENLNRITMFNYQNEPNLRIDYWFYPLASVASTSFDHTVDDFTLSYKASGKLTLGAEIAMSEADVSNKPIQALNERVATVPGELNCEQGFIRAACTFPLDHKNIVQGSVSVYYNDRLATGNILKQYTQYIVDTVQGTVEILITIPAGTTIIADYRYLPDREPGVESGEIWKVDGAYKSKATNLSMELRGADTFFTPIGGENNMEVSRFSYNLQHKFNPSLQISVRSMSVDTAIDLEQTNKNSQRQSQYDLNWSAPQKGMTLQLGYSTRGISDDFDPHVVDTGQKSYKISFGAPLPFINKAKFTYGMSKDKLTNNAAGGTGNETKQNNLSLSWNPSQQLNLSSAMNTSTLTSTSTTGTFSTRNSGRSLTMTYMPVPLITFGAKIDRQATRDSRPDTEPSIINQTMMRFDTRPFWKFNFLGFVHSKSDRPSVTTPSSHTESTTETASIAITRAISFAPSFITTSAVYGGTSENKADNSIYRLEYRPPGKPYHLVLGMEDGKRSTTSPTASTSYDVTRNTLEFGFNPSTIWSYSARYETEDNASSLGPSEDNGVDTLNFRVRYIPDGDRTHWLYYAQNKLSGKQSYTQSTIEFGLDYQLNKLFSWDLLYRITDNSDNKAPLNSYSGQLLESSLRIEF